MRLFSLGDEVLRCRLVNVEGTPKAFPGTGADWRLETMEFFVEGKGCAVLMASTLMNGSNIPPRRNRSGGSILPMAGCSATKLLRVTAIAIMYCC